MSSLMTPMGNILGVSPVEQKSSSYPNVVPPGNSYYDINNSRSISMIPPPPPEVVPCDIFRGTLESATAVKATNSIPPPPPPLILPPPPDDEYNPADPPRPGNLAA